MPRRRALTSERLADLYALPAAEPDLVRYWTLSADDLAAIERRRGGANQLGFALQLCAFRLLRPGEVIPEAALGFIANQLGIGPGALSATPGGPRLGASSSMRCA